MFTTRRITAWTGPLAALLAVALSYSNANADTLPTIIDESFPQFTNTVSIKNNSKKRTWSISGRKSGTFWMGVSEQYTVDALGFTANVLWNSDGSFNSGDVSISGKIDSELIGKQTLMTADLIAYEWDGTDFLGFNTSNIQCSADLNDLIGGAGCTTAESLLIDLDGIWDGNTLSKGLKLSGFATTSVPLPAAAWLLISGLGLLGITARRNRKAAI